MTDYENMTVSELDDILDDLGMAKTGLKQDKIDRLMDAENPEQETPEAGRDKPEVDQYEKMKSYRVRMWAGRIPVYECEFCGRQMDDKERMILHIMGHYPQEKREYVFETLVKDMDK